jgi:hypothetical protein
MNWLKKIFRRKPTPYYVREMLVTHPDGMVFSNDGKNWLKIEKCFYCGQQADEGDEWRWERNGDSNQQGHMDCFYKFWKKGPYFNQRSTAKENKLKSIFKGLTAIVLCYTLILTTGVAGCNTTWISKLDTIVADVAPSLINVLNIVAIAEGKPVNTALESKITADAANLKVLAADYAAATGTGALTACQQVQAGVKVVGDDFSVVLQLVQVSNVASQTNALAVFEAADAIFLTVSSLIPSCATPVALKAQIAAKVIAIDKDKLVRSYNAALTTPTKFTAVDKFNKSHQLHNHNWVLRHASFGKLQ